MAGTAIAVEVGHGSLGLRGRCRRKLVADRRGETILSATTTTTAAAASTPAGTPLAGLIGLLALCESSLFLGLVILAVGLLGGLLGREICFGNGRSDGALRQLG
ncbi:hypothetical protein ACQR14_27990, partial [Bradyrhizobium oligotrophicum]|uniref:hypothetical protein n=1 Tax=Bradyrhizobium oligotrophicum TaxID=44255 RepID=UPI003EBFEFEB